MPTYVPKLTRVLFLRVSIIAVICIVAAMFTALSSTTYIVSSIITSNVIQINNYYINMSKLQIVIGLGVRKCGTSSFNHLFVELTENINNHTNSSIYYHITNGEKHYWEQCLITSLVPKWLQNKHPQISNIHRYDRECTFNDYVESKYKNINISSYINNNNTEYKQLILGEKSVSYFLWYHSAYFLSYITYLYDIKFWVLLRNPICRTWSDYWMYNHLHLNDKFAANSPKDIEKMQQMIKNDLNQFSSYYAEYNDILNYIKTTDYKSIDENYIVTLYKTGLYDLYSRARNYYGSKLMMSCYYPILLMWKHVMQNEIINHWNFKQSVKLTDKLKIIQSEQFYKDPQKHVIDLIKWVSNDVISEANIGAVLKNVKTKQYAHYSPLSCGKHLSFYDELSNFYADCNEKLYQFVEEYPKIMLNNTFQTW